VLEAKIPLVAICVRIDHLEVDLKPQRLLVAELGNDRLGVLDLAAHRNSATIAGLGKPQGVVYEAYIANSSDGWLRLLLGDDFPPQGRVDLGRDPRPVCRLLSRHDHRGSARVPGAAGQRLFL
jgi:hypothetical protein